MSRVSGFNKIILLGGVCIASIAVPAYAQNAAEEGATDKNEIVVTAQRRDQSVQDIPFTVNAVSGDDLATASVTDVFALQNQVPGLDIRTTNPPSAGGAFSIRGLGTGVFNLGFEPSVGTVIDGIYADFLTMCYTVLYNKDNVSDGESFVCFFNKIGKAECIKSNLFNPGCGYLGN